jgi:hypothetical protein
MGIGEYAKGIDIIVSKHFMLGSLVEAIYKNRMEIIEEDDYSKRIKISP